MCNLNPKIRRLLDTGLTLGDVSSRNLGGTLQQRLCRVCKEAIGLGYCTVEQILAYTSSHLPNSTKEQVESALIHLVTKRHIVRSGEGYVMR